MGHSSLYGAPLRCVSRHLSVLLATNVQLSVGSLILDVAQTELLSLRNASDAPGCVHVPGPQGHQGWGLLVRPSRALPSRSWASGTKGVTAPPACPGELNVALLCCHLCLTRTLSGSAGRSTSPGPEDQAGCARASSLETVPVGGTWDLCLSRTRGCWETTWLTGPQAAAQLDPGVTPLQVSEFKSRGSRSASSGGAQSHCWENPDNLYLSP